MEYKKFGNTLIVRLDRGEEVVDRLLELARREHITLASVNGLGAADDVTVGVYFPATQEYKSNQFQGEYEIISLHGTLTTQEDQPYGHFHMSIGDQEGRVFGGHLNRAVIAPPASWWSPFWRAGWSGGWTRKSASTSWRLRHKPPICIAFCLLGNTTAIHEEREVFTWIPLH